LTSMRHQFRRTRMLQWNSKVVTLVVLLVAIAAFLGNFTWSLNNFTW
jgi:hypothetical protein